MKQLFIMLTVFLSLSSVQADPGRRLVDPSDTLQANDCVFKNKGIVALSEYEYIVDKCDRRYTNLLMIASDHLPQGACVYRLVQTMTGHTLAHVVQQCPSGNNNDQEIQGIIPDAPLEEVQQDDEGHMPPAPGEAPVKKAKTKPKAKPQPDAQQQQQPTDEIGALKLTAETLDQDATAAEANLAQAQKEYDAEKAKGASANKTKLDKLASDLEDIKAIARNARESANRAKAEYQAAVKNVTPAAPKAVKPKTNEQVEKGKQGYYLNPDEIEF